ncbi:MAG: hypothetical protein HY721_20810 [Planctomycetes bacterium]|nr:hypothetical protein [Planctomycetota bacterium]
MNLSTIADSSSFTIHRAPRPRVVFELGTHSLKIHSLSWGGLHTRKHAYALGHEVYATGRISASTLHQVAGLVQETSRDGSIAIGTGAVRDARNRDDLLRRLQDRLDHGAHVLSAREEALLLGLGYLASSTRLPALVADIGGGSVELVFLSRAGDMLWNSLPLGAIRLEHVAGDGVAGRIARIESELQRTSLVRSEDLYASGGTVRAITKTLGKATAPRREVEELERRVRAEGPPLELKPERAAVFHSGLLLTLKLLEQVGAERLHWVPLSVGRTFLVCAAQRAGAAARGA